MNDQRGKNKKGRFNKRHENENPIARYEGNVYAHIYNRSARIKILAWDKDFNLPMGREVDEAEGVLRPYLDEELVDLTKQQVQVMEENFDNWTEEDSTLIASA